MPTRVLVVDDDEVGREVVRRTLEARGFAVDAVSSGMAALAALDRDPPDVVVLDIVMPGLSGFDVLDRVKATPRLAAIPVIMVTAKASDDDVIASYRSGADYYITKPLVPDQLLYGIGLVLGREIPGLAAASKTPSAERSRPR